MHVTESHSNSPPNNVCIICIIDNVLTKQCCSNWKKKTSQNCWQRKMDWTTSWENALWPIYNKTLQFFPELADTEKLSTLLNRKVLQFRGVCLHVHHPVHYQDDNVKIWFAFDHFPVLIFHLHPIFDHQASGLGNLTKVKSKPPRIHWWPLSEPLELFFGRKEIRLVVEHKKFSIFDHFGARWCLLVYNSDDRFFLALQNPPT